MSKIAPLKNFVRTYTSTLKIAWETNRKYLLFIFGSSAISGILTFPGYLATKQVLDSIASAITTHEITQNLHLFLIATVLNVFIYNLRDYLSNLSDNFSATLSRSLMERIDINVARKLNKLPIKNAESPENRNLLQKITDNSGRGAWNLISSISFIPNNFFSLISSAAIVISFNPLFLIPGILLSFPGILVGTKLSRLRHQFRTEHAKEGRLWGAFESFTVQGKYLYENRILDHVNLLLKRRYKLTSTLFSKELALDTSATNQRQLVSIPNGIFSAIVSTYVFFQVIVGKITLGTAQIVANALTSFVGYISSLIRNGNEIYQNYLFVKDYEDFMALPEESSTSSDKLPKKLSIGIEFRNVWFRYPTTNRWILKGVSFHVGPTDNIAIVGVNGAGKSTLVKLLCRFYQPEKGEILVNGKNINDYDLKNYYHSIAALFQDFAQYPFSAKDNIRFGAIHEKASTKKLKQAANLAGIDGFISSLPLGYQNPLDKEFAGGIEPSKGQWQRIALARTLYRNAPLVILDEPTSNVDPESEEEIFRQILAVTKEKSVILISHRFSTVKIADQILVLQDGIITEQGNHSELLKKNGTYKKLFTLQAKSYQET